MLRIALNFTYRISVNNSDFSNSKIAHSNARKSLQLSPIITIPNLTHDLNTKEEEVISEKVVQNKQLSEGVDRIGHLDEDKERKQIVSVSFSLGDAKHLIEATQKSARSPRPAANNFRVINLRLQLVLTILLLSGVRHLAETEVTTTRGIRVRTGAALVTHSIHVCVVLLDAIRWQFY